MTAMARHPADRKVMAMVIDNTGSRIDRNVIKGVLAPAQPVRTGRPESRQDAAAVGFDSILRQKQKEIEELKFSRHAEYRLRSRNISLTPAQRDKMKEAVTKAESKGVRDTLVLMDDLAFVVNVRNMTVITAVQSNELKENVFTNIDGAVII